MNVLPLPTSAHDDVVYQTLQRGRPTPMGAHPRDGGVNFAVYSANATAMWLCTFGLNGQQSEQRWRMHGPVDGVFFGFAPDMPIGTVYGFRAQGDYAPAQGQLFNPNKLLLDPYAQEIVGEHVWSDLHFGYQRLGGVNLQQPDHADNAAVALKARVVETGLAAEPIESRPYVAPEKVVLYEVHVKGFSQLNQEIDPSLRGTYLGLCSDAAIAYFKSLGVTTLSLLPVHYHVDEQALTQRGHVNYWGYNTHGFFCADPRLCTQPESTAQANHEFALMVQRLHQHGLQVVLDVVFNHSAEGSEYGPTLSFRGLDNKSWYHLDYTRQAQCINYTGCGNTLNISHPRVCQFVLDSLRHWVVQMGVDGFRFDLASILGRDDHGYSSQAVFFRALLQDPVLSQVHLIAEPWDATSSGYQLGNYPGRFLDWNDKFRDTVRRFWLDQSVTRGEFAKRFCASSDIFQNRGRLPSSSVNYISVHDGFTLMDMVSYSQKHNHANGEQNRDGRDQEPCANFGVEGQTHSQEVMRRRQLIRKALMASLILAQGTPMLCAGDEIGRTQQGNNNPYCQDNAISWLNWVNADQEFLAFTRKVLQLRQQLPELAWQDWPGQTEIGALGERLSMQWSLPSGQPLCTQAWEDTQHHAFGCDLHIVSAGAETAQPSRACSLILFNPEVRDTEFRLPRGRWTCMLDTAGGLESLTVSDSVMVLAHSILLLKQVS